LLKEKSARIASRVSPTLVEEATKRTGIEADTDPIAREHGFGRIEVANRSMVGFSRIYLNEPREARDDGAATVRAAALVGEPRAEMLAETIGVFACYELGS